MSEILAISDESLAKAAGIIGDGGVIVIPTDTVYGIVGDPRNGGAIDRIYELKRRPRFKALQVLLADIDQLDRLDLALPAPLNRLAARFLPGAFSPIAVAKDGCTLRTLAKDGTQGVRVPNSTLCLKALRALGPLAASSANLSGGESAQSVHEAFEAFGDRVPLYLDGGSTPGHVASTVVAADPHERDGIRILREGVIPQSAIRAALHVNGGGLGA